MAKFFNWLLSFCSCKKELLAIAEEEKKEVSDLKERIIALEALTSFLASELYTVKVYRLGPFPGGHNGVLEGEVTLQKVSPAVREALLKNGNYSSCGGVNPVSWGGTKWVLCRK